MNGSILYSYACYGHILYELWCATLNSMHSYWTLLYCYFFMQKERFSQLQVLDLLSEFYGGREVLWSQNVTLCQLRPVLGLTLCTLDCLLVDS